VPPAQAAPAAIVSDPRFDAAYLDNPAPVYPALSRRMSEEGRVLLRVYVEAGGRPSQVQIKTSSGSPRLDRAAGQAVSRWKFIPARRGAEAVGAWVLVPIVFNLRG
jgi:protein TonB